MEDLEQKELREFSWTIFFSVTGICFFLFSFLLKLLDGGNISLFIKIGLINIGLALICLFNKWLDWKETKKRQQKPTSIFRNE